jgi:hypothetical protein
VVHTPGFLQYHVELHHDASTAEHAAPFAFEEPVPAVPGITDFPVVHPTALRDVRSEEAHFLDGSVQYGYPEVAAEAFKSQSPEIPVLDPVQQLQPAPPSDPPSDPLVKIEQSSSSSFSVRFPNQRTASKRGPFKDQLLRQQTANMRKAGSCIRCKMQRIRVCGPPRCRQAAQGLN